MLKIIFDQVVKRLFPKRSMQSLTKSEILRAENEAIQIMNRTKGKTGEVIDLTGRKIDTSQPIIGGKNIESISNELKKALDEKKTMFPGSVKPPKGNINYPEIENKFGFPLRGNESLSELAKIEKMGRDQYYNSLADRAMSIRTRMSRVDAEGGTEIGYQEFNKLQKELDDLNDFITRVQKEIPEGMASGGMAREKFGGGYLAGGAKFLGKKYKGSTLQALLENPKLLGAELGHDGIASILSLFGFSEGGRARVGFGLGKLVLKDLPEWAVKQFKHLNELKSYYSKLPPNNKDTLDLFNKVVIQRQKALRHTLEVGGDEKMFNRLRIGPHKDIPDIGQKVKFSQIPTDEPKTMRNVKGQFGFDFVDEGVGSLDNKTIRKAVDDIFPTGDYKYDAEMAAEALVENNPKAFGNKLYDDLSDADRSDVYGAVLPEVQNDLAKMLQAKRLSKPKKTEFPTLEKMPKSSPKDDLSQEIKKGVEDVMKDTSDEGLKRSIETDNLKLEFPGISDEMINNILTDTNPQRIAEVKQTMREALEMGEKGMGPDEIIKMFKDTTRTKQASGGIAGQLHLNQGGRAGFANGMSADYDIDSMRDPFAPVPDYLQNLPTYDFGGTFYQNNPSPYGMDVDKFKAAYAHSQGMGDKVSVNPEGQIITDFGSWDPSNAYQQYVQNYNRIGDMTGQKFGKFYDYERYGLTPDRRAEMKKEESIMNAMYGAAGRGDPRDKPGYNEARMRGFKPEPVAETPVAEDSSNLSQIAKIASDAIKLQKKPGMLSGNVQAKFHGTTPEAAQNILKKGFQAKSPSGGFKATWADPFQKGPKAFVSNPGVASTYGSTKIPVAASTQNLAAPGGGITRKGIKTGMETVLTPKQFDKGARLMEYAKRLKNSPAAKRLLAGAKLGMPVAKTFLGKANLPLSVGTTAFDVAMKTPAIQKYGTMLGEKLYDLRNRGIDERMAGTYEQNKQLMADQRMNAPMGAAKGGRVSLSNGGLANILGV